MSSTKRRVFSKEVRAKALKMVAEGVRPADISKELGVHETTISKWRTKAGIAKFKKRAVRPRASRVLTERKPRSVLDGSLKVVAALITEPGLNSEQRVKMIEAYLNAR